MENKQIVYVDHGSPRYVDTKANPCKCGGEINVAVAFGRRPYCFHCESCHKNYGNDVTNCDAERAIQYFNSYISDQEQPFKFYVIGE